GAAPPLPHLPALPALSAPRLPVQNRNFAANCTWRAEPESPVGNRVFEITPNDVLPKVAVRPGCPRFAWLNRLNTSRRNCARAVPLNFRFLMIEKSVLPKPGP